MDVENSQVRLAGVSKGLLGGIDELPRPPFAGPRKSAVEHLMDWLEQTGAGKKVEPLPESVFRSYLRPEAPKPRKAVFAGLVRQGRKPEVV